MRDLADGLDGWLQANGAKKSDDDRMTRDRMAELKARYGN